MHVCVLDLFSLVRISVMSESPKAWPVEIDCERLIACDQNIDPHIEFFPSNQKGVHNVTLYYIGFCLWTFWLPSEVVFPLSDLSELIQQEDSPTLWLADRFHNPYSANFAELFNEQGVVSRKIVCRWEKVESKNNCYRIINASYAAASSNFPSFSNCFLYRLRFFTIKSFLVSSKWFLKWLILWCGWRWKWFRIS